MMFTKLPYVIGLFFQPETAPPGQGFDLVLVPHKSWALGFFWGGETLPKTKIESLVGLVELKPILRYFHQNNKALNGLFLKKKSKCLPSFRKVVNVEARRESLGDFD